MSRVLSETEKDRIRREQATGGTTLSNITIDNGATYTQMRYLARVYEAAGHERFKEGFLRGVDYLLEAQYEIGTNSPMFLDREGNIHYALSQIPHERRTGYDWLGDWPRDLLEERYPARHERWGGG